MELGTQLRHLRENCPPVEEGRARGMTRKEAVRGLKATSEASLARIERGEANFRRNVSDLRSLLKRYNVSDEHLVEQMLELNREGPGEEWLTQFRHVMPTGMPHYVGLEAEASEILGYHPTVVYGLLQTEDYARALFESQRPVEDTTSEFVQRNIELRMERKRRVLAQNVRLRFILGEAALRTPYGDEETMREQYIEIAKLAEQDRIQVQVLPFKPRSYRSNHDFTILDLGGLPSRVQTDNAWGAVSTSDKPREVDRFKQRFSAMVGAALGLEETITFLKKLT
ncbi:helix-turn-helix domain-containing protein (plasmid) [Streptomyces halstedii]|uniref:helix-turn-helix domain-containing protein n=1 Tax=Streptomyces halstedii TaxID=1944 RepID=UPI001EF20781|nr:helix-turn-helix transcriptional regulator [Streptomyces halstedii]